MNKMDVLTERGVERILPDKESLIKKLASGERLRVYLGVDPTGPMQLHHTIPMRKLRHFQDLGHQVILLIGSFTATIGDPTGKSKSRVPLSKEVVLQNAHNYVELAKGILDFENNIPEVAFNGDWLEKLSFREVVELAAHFTVQQMIERDMFQERIKNGQPISLHEFLYPLMQGYDSVALKCDVEVGGNDQTFNMMAGRKLVDQYLAKEKFVISVPLLTDEVGRKTSTSDGTGISLDLSAQDLYAKVMSLPDGFLRNMYDLCTETTLGEIDEMMAAISEGKNPMGYKKQLAHILTKTFHGTVSADSAQLEFEKTVQGHQLPAEIAEVTIVASAYEARNLLVQTSLCSSLSDAKRALEDGAVGLYDSLESEERRIGDPKEMIDVRSGMIIRVGKRRFVKLKLRGV